MPAALQTPTSERGAQLPTVQRWRGFIDTQMHFNAMLMQTRAIGVSIVIAAFGLLLLAAVFVLDYLYYYRMLLSLVRCTEELEPESWPNADLAQI